MRRPRELAAAGAGVVVLGAVLVALVLSTGEPAASSPAPTPAVPSTPPGPATPSARATGAPAATPERPAPAGSPAAPIVISAGSALGPGHAGLFTASTKIPDLGQAVTWRFSGGAALAGASVEIQATDRDFPVSFRSVATVTADASGTAYYTTSFDRPAYLSVRAAIVEAAGTVSAASRSRIASWRGHGRCAGGHTPHERSRRHRVRRPARRIGEDRALPVPPRGREEHGLSRGRR